MHVNYSASAWLLLVFDYSIEPLNCYHSGSPIDGSCIRFIQVLACESETPVCHDGIDLSMAAAVFVLAQGGERC